MVYCGTASQGSLANQRVGPCDMAGTPPSQASGVSQGLLNKYPVINSQTNKGPCLILLLGRRVQLFRYLNLVPITRLSPTSDSTLTMALSAIASFSLLGMASGLAFPDATHGPGFVSVPMAPHKRQYGLMRRAAVANTADVEMPSFSDGWLVNSMISSKY